MSYAPCRYAARWPELFAPLSDEQKQGISDALANGRLEGDEPTPQEVADLVALELGRIDHQEYQHRALERARALEEVHTVQARENIAG